MKKSSLLTGIAFSLAGLSLLAAASAFETKLNDLFIGFSGALLGPGLMLIGKTLYWSAPKNKGKYAQKLEDAAINSRDERNQKLRDQSGRYAYLWGLAVLSISIVLFSILGELGIVPGYRLLVLYLGAFAAFEIVIGIVLYERLKKQF